MSQQDSSSGGGTFPRIGDMSAAAIQLAQVIESTGTRAQELTDKLNAHEITIQTNSGEIAKLSGILAATQGTFDSQLQLLREANSQTNNSIESLVRDLAQLQQSYSTSSQAVSTTTEALNDRIRYLNQQLDNFQNQLSQFPTMENIRTAMTDKTSPLATQSNVDSKILDLSTSISSLQGSVETSSRWQISLFVAIVGLIAKEILPAFLGASASSP